MSERRNDWVDANFGFVCFIVTGLTVICLFIALLFYPKPVQAKLAAMPAQLDLGGVNWYVDSVEVPGNSLGFVAYTRCDIKHIEIRSNVADKREDLFHEILHAYTCQDSKTFFDVNNAYYNSRNDGAHVGYDRISQVVTDALQRNPSLAAYLAGGN